MRLVLSLAVLATATFTAATAEAAVSNGTFTGKTTAKDPIGLTVGAGSRITSLHYDSVHMTCTDEDKYDMRRTEVTGAKFRIRSGGKWTAKVSTRGGASTWTATGRFNAKGTRSTGTLTINQRFNVENELDPEGPIRCESGKVKFTVTRR